MDELAGKELVAGSQKSTLTPIGGVLGGEGRLKKVVLMLKIVEGSTSTLAPADTGKNAVILHRALSCNSKAKHAGTQLTHQDFEEE